MNHENSQDDDAQSVPDPPEGWKRLAWLGPGFLWMVSAAGSGELLFTPRVGALYGYSLLWALVAAVTLKWFINREIGRFTAVTGASILDGFKSVSGPGNWAVWIILVPQVVVAVATIAGLGSAAATALLLVVPGSVRIWTIVSILVATGLVVWGRYSGVERVAVAIALALALASIVAATRVFPPVSDFAGGLAPSVPARVRYGEILPWLGFMLSGAAGMIWYSYWLRAKGYGATGIDRDEDEPMDPDHLSKADRDRLRGWTRQITFDNTVAVMGTLVITLAFLVLGAELLQPRGLVPQGTRVAEVLGRLLGGVWGPIGFWFMILGVYVGFWDTVLSDQDGFGRMFASGTRIVLGDRGVTGRWVNESFLKNAYVVVLVTVLPIALFLLVGKPVGLLKVAGAVEAAHIPILTGLTLYLNRRQLPDELQPSTPALIITAIAGLFFAGFAVVYVYFQITGGSGV